MVKNSNCCNYRIAAFGQSIAQNVPKPRAPCNKPGKRFCKSFNPSRIEIKIYGL